MTPEVTKSALKHNLLPIVSDKHILSEPDERKAAAYAKTSTCIESKSKPTQSITHSPNYKL